MSNSVAIVAPPPRLRITDVEHGELNKKGINVIRHDSTRGHILMGARTLASKNASDTRWHYIPVRRLFLAAERDIKAAMQQAVFEPNNAVTWEKVRSALDAYLMKLWRKGALVGEKPEEAYSVQIGPGLTMTKDDIENGKMIVKIGMAAVRPAEFIILQMAQTQSGGPA